MSLSNKQRKLLNLFRSFEDNPPTFSSLLINSLPCLLRNSVLFGLGAYCMYMSDSFLTAAFVIGLASGIWLITIGTCLAATRNWAFLIQVINWQKFDELLDEENS